MASNNSDNEIKYLHGDLHLKIVEARCLPKMVSGNLLRCFTAIYCRKLVMSNRRWRHYQHSNINSRGLFVSVNLSGCHVAQTRFTSNLQNPVWNQNFKIPLAHPASEVEFRVRDYDGFRASLIGVATVLAKRIATGEVIDEWFQVKGTKSDAALRLQMAFLPCYKNLIYLKGIWENYGLKESYFPWRNSGKVTLYQDAHVTDGMLPEITLDDGQKFEHQHCWEDIFHAVLEAQYLVYIGGWSIYHKVRLVREPTKPLPNLGDLNLGELLKHKSESGVRVLVVSDNMNSSNFIHTMGAEMREHNEETRKFFKDSSVTCVLLPRYASSKDGGTYYSHHQKCVIVDTQDHGSNRKITAFIGGLDLCNGRYDTPEHRLFRDLNTVFKDDYHNPTFPPGKKAPRQPWHDLHCKIEGPAAYDVLTNFEQRWRRAASRRKPARWFEIGRWFKKTPDSLEDAFLKIKEIPCITSPKENPPMRVSEEDDHESANVNPPVRVSEEDDHESPNVDPPLRVSSEDDRQSPNENPPLRVSEEDDPESPNENEDDPEIPNKNSPMQVSLENDCESPKENPPLRVSEEEDPESPNENPPVRVSEEDDRESPNLNLPLRVSSEDDRESPNENPPLRVSEEDDRENPPLQVSEEDDPESPNEKEDYPENPNENPPVQVSEENDCESSNKNPPLRVSNEDDPENWHVQVFRSIDSMSLEGFPEDADKAEEINLVLEGDLVVDRSIQRAYIQAIRSAKHFIYIETQCFIGSSFAWLSYRELGADNLIPIELALKIASKIRAKERFTVYVVIPMWPEGDPTGIPVQQILYWERQTMQVMYTIIAQEIKSAKLENAHPTDYLNFYCLGKREDFHEEEPDASGLTSLSGDHDLASKKFRRFMIYVHSKGMIVDDEYVILGSANNTEESMAGSGNTEIAIGAYQPHYTLNKKKEHPHGQVYGFRMSLWAEHIGTIEDCFEDPENLACVKRINDIAVSNWERYKSSQFTLLHGHILKYPFYVDANGNLKPVLGLRNFPDVGGQVYVC